MGAGGGKLMGALPPLPTGGCACVCVHSRARGGRGPGQGGGGRGEGRGLGGGGCCAGFRASACVCACHPERLCSGLHRCSACARVAGRLSRGSARVF